MNQVKDDLYEIVGDGGNVAVYITNEGVILVDDKYDQDFDGIMAKVEKRHEPAGEIYSQHASPRRPQWRKRQVPSHGRDHFDR